MATIQGQHLFCSDLPTLLLLFKGGDVYLKKYGKANGLTASGVFKLIALSAVMVIITEK